MEKVFPCLTCGQDIKLERKEDKWVRWNLDGTLHVDQKKFKASQTVENLARIESKIDTLLTEVAYLREELKSKK